eukprot:6016439-Amphidinium_carterae.1
MRSHEAAQITVWIQSHAKSLNEPHSNLDVASLVTQAPENTSGKRHARTACYKFDLYGPGGRSWLCSVWCVQESS